MLHGCMQRQNDDRTKQYSRCLFQSHASQGKDRLLKNSTTCNHVTVNISNVDMEYGYRSVIWLQKSDSQFNSIKELEASQNANSHKSLEILTLSIVICLFSNNLSPQGIDE